MRLTVAGQLRDFISLKRFRAERELPRDFNIDHFEPKIWVGLGAMDSRRATDGMEILKQEVLKAVPTTVEMNDLLKAVDEIGKVFFFQLQAANTHIHLKDEEVDFAVSGFNNVMRDVAYRLLQLNHTHQGDRDTIRSAFSFHQVYYHWIDSSARISGVAHLYSHRGITFKVQVIYNVYGRVGLEVVQDDQVFYLEDTSLACPASSYMMTLCEGTTKKLCEALLGKEETASEDKENTN